jgi:HemY protein
MARALRAPRDPEWSADGFVSDRWMPVSPVSGRLDAFQWKVPLAELGEPRDVIEGFEETAPRPVVVAQPSPPAAELPRASESVAAGPTAPARPPTATSGSAATPPRVEPVIPLLHVPDDPGPDPVPDEEPEPSGSRGLRLFK